MKNLWQKIQDVEPIIFFAYAFAILFIGGLVIMSLQSCELVRSLTGTASVVKDTLTEADTDGSGTISMQEILTYCLMGWASGRGAETAGKFGAKRLRNGRKRNERTCAESSEP